MQLIIIKFLFRQYFPGARGVVATTARPPFVTPQIFHHENRAQFDLILVQSPISTYILYRSSDMARSTIRRTKMSRSQLEEYIRRVSADSRNVFFTNHVWQQMKARHITMASVMSTLNVAVIVAISDDDPTLLLITAMSI